MDYFTALPSKLIDVVSTFIISLGFFVSPAPITNTVPEVPPPQPSAEVRSASHIAPATATTSTPTPSSDETEKILEQLRTIASSSTVIDAGVVPVAPVVAQVYESDPGGPLFATLTLPRLKENQTSYPIYLWNGSTYTFYADLAPLETLSFPKGGVAKFKIGIDPTLKLHCDSFFPKQITFTTSGVFKGTSYRLTASPDHPVCEE